MALELITPPTEEPVSLALVKSWAKVEHSDDDTLFTDILIPGARQQVEHELQRALCLQTWELSLDAFPEVEIRLGKPLLQQVTQITYIDLDGQLQVLAPGLYTVDADSDEGGWVLPAIDQTWPDTLDTANAVRVQFIAGYGSASAVPAGIKSAILIIAATMYKFRENIAAGMSVAALPDDFLRDQLDPFRYYGGGT